MKTSERLLAALRHTDDDLLDLEREISEARAQLSRLEGLRSLLEQLGRMVRATPDVAREEMAVPPPAPPAPLPEPVTMRVDRNGKGHIVSTAIDPIRNPPLVKQPAGEWMPQLIERIRECIREHGPATKAALRLRLKCNNNRLLLALRHGPFRVCEGLYHDREAPAAPAPALEQAQGETAQKERHAGGRTADDLRQAAAFVLLDDGEMLLPEVASEIGVTGAELLPLLRDHPWFRWAATSGWSLTDVGREALTQIDLDAEERGE